MVVSKNIMPSRQVWAQCCLRLLCGCVIKTPCIGAGVAHSLRQARLHTCAHAPRGHVAQKLRGLVQTTPPISLSARFLQPIGTKRPRWLSARRNLQPLVDVSQVDAFWLDWSSHDPSSSSWDWTRDANQVRPYCPDQDSYRSTPVADPAPHMSYSEPLCRFDRSWAKMQPRARCSRAEEVRPSPMQ